uniref:acid phosphatase n=1 Tax=Timema tahoe TaxID=61484 RepID=A0A7R9IMJ0_9NEOP|nr:unnamed protein product [Timema tahoe]
MFHHNTQKLLDRGAEDTRKLHVYYNQREAGKSYPYTAPTLCPMCGPLVGDIAQHMADKRTGALAANQKLFLYSAHDLTIVNVWRALGMTEMLKPESGAALIFELHLVGTNKEFQIEVSGTKTAQAERPTSEYSSSMASLVLTDSSQLTDDGFEKLSDQIMYPYAGPYDLQKTCVFYLNNTSTLEPHPLTIEECGTPCFLDTFINLTIPVIPTDWEKECQLNLTFEIT